MLSLHRGEDCAIVWRIGSRSHQRYRFPHREVTLLAPSVSPISYFWSAGYSRQAPNVLRISGSGGIPAHRYEVKREWGSDLALVIFLSSSCSVLSHKSPQLGRLFLSSLGPTEIGKMLQKTLPCFPGLHSQCLVIYRFVTCEAALDVPKSSLKYVLLGVQYVVSNINVRLKIFTLSACFWRIPFKTLCLSLFATSILLLLPVWEDNWG